MNRINDKHTYSRIFLPPVNCKHDFQNEATSIGNDSNSSLQSTAAPSRAIPSIQPFKIPKMGDFLFLEIYNVSPEGLMQKTTTLGVAYGSIWEDNQLKIFVRQCFIRNCHRMVHDIPTFNDIYLACKKQVTYCSPDLFV